LNQRSLQGTERCPNYAIDILVPFNPDGSRTTVGALADAEPLMALPWAPYPATVVVERTVADNATVAFRGNTNSVPPGLGGSVFEVRHRLSTPTLEIHAASGRLVAAHMLARAGARHPPAQSRAPPGTRGSRARRLHHEQALSDEGQVAFSGGRTYPSEVRQGLLDGGGCCVRSADGIDAGHPRKTRSREDEFRLN
jgi:hypothetical protein